VGCCLVPYHLYILLQLFSTSGKSFRQTVLYCRLSLGWALANWQAVGGSG
jgi:hypothetical protein